MDLIKEVAFKVFSDTFFSKFSYMFKRVFIRIGHKFLIFIIVSVLVAFFIAFVYYNYISRMLWIQEFKIMNLLKKVIKPTTKRKKSKELTDHEVFTKRQLKKMQKRKRMFESFGSEKIVKKPKREEQKELDLKKIQEIDEKEGYVMWPPKPKKRKKEKEVFDKLGKIE